MRSRNLKDIKKQIAEENARKNAEFQFEIYNACIDDVFKASAACMITVMHRRGLSKRYIQKFFNEFCFILEFPEMFGVSKGSDEMMKEYAELYDIDFDRIRVFHETLEEFKHRCKIR